MELWKSVISKICCQVSFVTLNSDASVGSLDHVDIIGTITNSHSVGSNVILNHELDDRGLVSWRASIDNDGMTLLDQLSKALRKSWAFNNLMD